MGFILVYKKHSFCSAFIYENVPFIEDVRRFRFPSSCYTYQELGLGNNLFIWSGNSFLTLKLSTAAH